MSVAEKQHTVLDALRALANVCDGARNQDGIGFNGSDTAFGKSLARQNALSARQESAARKMLIKYRSQLEKHGIDVHSLQSSAYHSFTPDQPVQPTPSNGHVSLVSPVKAPILSNNRRARLDGKKIVFSFPYDGEIKDSLKENFPRMAIFDGQSKTWSIPTSKISEGIAWARKHSFDVSDLEQKQLEISDSEKAEQLARERRYQNRLVKIDLENVGSGLTLREYQKAGIKDLLRKERSILADDMGLGKTLQALIAAKAYQSDHAIFVIAPISVHGAWLREAERVNVRIEVFSWAKIPSVPENRQYILICDEAHYAQNLKAQRTQKMLDLAVQSSATYLLTGTPIKNGRPVNLYPLLVAIKHELTKNRKAYEQRYCDAKATRFTAWDTTGSTHLEELKEKISDVLIRRTKTEVLKELPEKTRVLLPLELSADDSRVYHSTVARLQSEYQERLRKGEICSEGEALVMLNHLRHAGSLAKTNSACDLAEEILEQGQSVVLFFEFADSAKKAGEKLHRYGVSLLTGETPQKERDVLIHNFQLGHNRVFIGTIKAGGVGITLTASSTLLAVDRPWTPGDIVQAEDRIHRIGQKNACTIYWLQTGETDEKIDRILEGKAKNIGVVLGDESIQISYSMLAADLLG